MKYSFLLILLAAVSLRADPLDKLIEGEKQAREEWEDAAGELPPMYMWGDRTGVVLASCDAIPFDELIEISRGNPKAVENTLNLDIPRVRDILEEGCLFRPGDKIMVVTESEKRRVAIDRMVIRRGRDYSLWGLFVEPLSTSPIFFATHEEWTEGPLQSNHVFESKAVKKDHDFDAVTIELGAANAERLEILRRRSPTLEDDKLPSEVLLRHLKGEAATVWTERVNVKKGSGRIRVELSMDYNDDGLVDLIVSGSHESRPFQLILEGTEDGFSMKNVTLF